MSYITNIKTSTLSDKGQITIPKQFIKDSGILDRKVVIITYDDHIEIRPLNKVDKLEKLTEAEECMYASRESFLEIWDTPEEDKAWEYLQKEK